MRERQVDHISLPILDSFWVGCTWDRSPTHSSHLRSGVSYSGLEYGDVGQASCRQTTLCGLDDSLKCSPRRLFLRMWRIWKMKYNETPLKPSLTTTLHVHPNCAMKTVIWLKGITVIPSLVLGPGKDHIMGGTVTPQKICAYSNPENLWKRPYLEKRVFPD